MPEFSSDTNRLALKNFYETYKENTLSEEILVTKSYGMNSINGYSAQIK